MFAEDECCENFLQNLQENTCNSAVAAIEAGWQLTTVNWPLWAKAMKEMVDL